MTAALKTEPVIAARPRSVPLLSGLRARVSLAFGVVVAVWVAIAWFWSRAPEAAGDLMGWRQADTQTIALNLLRPGSSLLYPQVAWGGDGPGYVEAELQLYPALTALLMRIVGPAEWPGQFLSLLSVLVCALALWFHHERNQGIWPAAAAVGTFLGARSIVQLATAIQPDAFALTLYTLAWIAFTSYVRTGSRAKLVWFGVCGALTLLVKPPNAHLGISSALFLFLAYRKLLKRWEVWLTWALMLVLLGAYLLHAKSIYQEFGNTFGLLSGGDSKSPKLEHLLTPKIWFSALQRFVFWGVGVPGALALVWLTFKRRLSAEHVALLVGNGFILVMALRYTSAPEGGHYFAPAAVLGASAVAQLVHVGFADARLKRLGTVFVLGLAAFQVGGAQWLRHRSRLPNEFTVIPVETGKALKNFVQPGSLIVVRSYEPTYDEYWRTPNNYEDPTIFYITGTHGWAIGSEQLDGKLLERYSARGARYVADPLPAPTPNAFHDWLSRHADLLTTTEHGGRVWRLRS